MRNNILKSEMASQQKQISGHLVMLRVKQLIRIFMFSIIFFGQNYIDGLNDSEHTVEWWCLNGSNGSETK